MRLEVVRRSDGHGIPIGWAIDGANRNDLRLLHPTLDAVEATGLLHDIATLHLDRGYDYPDQSPARRRRDSTELDIQKRGTKAPPGAAPAHARAPMDRRGHQLVVVELRTTPPQHRPRERHRHAALCLATAMLIVGRLIDYRDRWSPPC